MPRVDWIWDARTALARLARLALLPPALVFRVTAATRVSAYRWGWLARRTLPLPTVAVGNIAAGGTGKTPLTAWIARFYAARGLRPGILLRGYGGDEAEVHRAAVPDAIVVEGADRVRAARAALERGARVLVLDDAFQRLDVHRDLDLALVSADARSAPWPLPAGPWREGWRALRRADLIVVTAKAANEPAVSSIVDRARALGRRPVAVAHIGLRGLREMRSGAGAPLARLRGSRVLAVAGIADPRAFARQLSAQAGAVHLIPFADHHPFGKADVARILRAAAEVDYVVVTAKDAAKLSSLWPVDHPAPWVADLDVTWQSGRCLVERALVEVAADTRETVAADPGCETEHGIDTHHVIQ